MNRRTLGDAGPIGQVKGSRAFAQAAPNGALYCACVPELRVLDGRSLTEQHRWSLPDAVRGLALSRDGKRLYAGQEEAVVMLDTTNGRMLASASYAIARARGGSRRRLVGHQPSPCPFLQERKAGQAHHQWPTSDGGVGAGQEGCWALVLCWS